MLLKVSNLSKEFNGLSVIDGLNFSLSKGEIALLRGANGCGKTTLFKCLIGLEKANQGQIFFQNSDLSSKNTSQIISQGIAYMPQESFLLPKFSVEQNLKLARQALNKRTLSPKQDLQVLLTEILDYENFSKQKVGSLSRGERKKLEFRIILMQEAELYLLDEPVSGWDAEARGLAYQVLEKLKKDNRSILIVEHSNDPELMQITDRVFSLEESKLTISHD